MKNKIVGILVTTLLIATALHAVGAMNEVKDICNENNCSMQPTVEWEKTFGGDEFDMIYSVEQTNDGGYIACGTTEESGMNYVWLLKLDSDGNEEWSVVNHDLNASKMTSADMQVLATYVIQTDDDGYIIAGWGITDVVVQGETAWVQVGYLWKVQASGATEWLKHNYGDEEELWVYLPYHIIEFEESYMVSGWKIYFNMQGQVTNMDGMLMKTDENGNVEWEQTYDTGGEDKPCSLCPTSDGGYLLTGCTDGDDVAAGAFWMVKTEGDGNKQWDSIFDGPKFEYSFVRYCFQTSDGGYIMCGNTQSYGAGKVDLWIIKTDSSGNKEWDKTFGGTQNDYTWSFDATTDGGYVFGVAKNYGGFGGTKDDIWIVKTDKDGNAEWKFQIEKEGTQCTRDICQTDDGGYIVAAATSSVGSAKGDGYLVKVAPFENQRPNKPAKPTGPSSGKPDREYTFSTSTTDPDGDSLQYMWDWGDGNFSEWLDTNEATYTWTTKDNFEVRVKAMDENGGESDWSDPFTFSTPKNKEINQLFLQFLEDHTHLFPLLRQLLGL
jgi:hypothetical protein